MGGTVLSPLLSRTIVLFPIACVLIYVLGLNLPATRGIALWSLQENKPVEILTFVLLFVGGVLGLRVARQSKVRGEPTPVVAFYLLLGVLLLLVAMEEIAWGQQFFGFATPELIKHFNAQDEITLHNVEGLQGHTEWFRLMFGLSGWLGVILASRPWFRPIGVPAVLLSHFMVITPMATIDLVNDTYSLGREADRIVNRLSELVEMLCGGAGFLYVWLNGRMLVATTPPGRGTAL
jgi:hypothetical protein